MKQETYHIISYVRFQTCLETAYLVKNTRLPVNLMFLAANTRPSPLTLRFNVISPIILSYHHPYHPRVGLIRDIFPSGIGLCHLSQQFITHIIPLFATIVTISGDEYKLRTSLCDFLHPPIPFFSQI